MGLEEQIANRFLIWAVTAAAILPRHPFDHGCIIGGGPLTRNFRRMLLAIVGVNLIRLFLSATNANSSGGRTDDSYALYCGYGSDFLGVVEVTGVTFLCFLLPYILQKGLSEYFHIIPGANLYRPLYATAGLSIAGVVFSRTIHPNYWALKKLANVVSGPVILQTVKSYNSFTTRESHGRGFVLGQTVMVVEYTNIIVQLLCTLAYAYNRGDVVPIEEVTTLDIILKAIRSSAMRLDWTRVLAHAIFLNQLDELFSTSRGGNFTERTDSSSSLSLVRSKNRP